MKLLNIYITLLYSKHLEISFLLQYSDVLIALLFTNSPKINESSSSYQVFLCNGFLLQFLDVAKIL